MWGDVGFVERTALVAAGQYPTPVLERSKAPHSRANLNIQPHIPAISHSPRSSIKKASLDDPAARYLTSNLMLISPSILYRGGIDLPHQPQNLRCSTPLGPLRELRHINPSPRVDPAFTSLSHTPGATQTCTWTELTVKRLQIREKWRTGPYS
jgi:hypothetical protein